MFSMLTPMGSNLSGSFSDAWSKVTAAVPGLTSLLNLVGVVLVSYAIGKFIWDRKRGGGQGGAGGGGQGLIVMLIIGALCTMPGVVFPILLKFADWVVDLLVNFFK